MPPCAEPSLPSTRCAPPRSVPSLVLDPGLQPEAVAADACAGPEGWRPWVWAAVMLPPSGVQAVAARLEPVAAAPARAPPVSALADRLKAPAAVAQAPALDPYPQLRELAWRVSALDVPPAVGLPRAEPPHRALQPTGADRRASLRQPAFDVHAYKAVRVAIRQRCVLSSAAPGLP